MRYKVKLKCGRVMMTDPMFLQNPSDLDIAKVPITEGNYKNDLPNLKKAELSYLAHPTPLSKDDQEWLEAHNRLNHMSRKDMCTLAEQGVLPKKLSKYKYRAPFCASCAFGKAHKRQWTSKGKHYNPIRSKRDDKPGARVSVDQLISAQPGLVPQTGGTLKRSRIHCSTIFIDHLTSFAFSFLQRSTGHEETLDAKASFEKFANVYDVTIRSYHADNGRFAETAFKNDCKRCDQDISFCAVGAHNQNGIVEANTKTFTLGARTSLLHAKRLRPEAITTMLWPFALQYFVNCYNTFHLDDEGKSPLMKFSGVNEHPSIDHFHPFGCPVFVLESKLQTSSKGIPKWDPRSRLGIYLGHSPLHAGSVALVLIPITGHVSPQYHVVFDDTFSTVSNLRSGTVPPNWRKLVEESSYFSTDEDYDLSQVWLREVSLAADDESVMMQGQASADATNIDSEGAPHNQSTASEGDFFSIAEFGNT